MKASASKGISMEELTRMVQNGFSDLKNSLVSRKEFSGFREVVLDQFRLLNAEVKDIKTTLGPTAVIVTQQERRLQTLESRLDHVEKKVGIVHLNR